MLIYKDMGEQERQFPVEVVKILNLKDFVLPSTKSACQPTNKQTFCDNKRGAYSHTLINPYHLGTDARTLFSNDKSK